MLKTVHRFLLVTIQLLHCFNLQMLSGSISTPVRLVPLLFAYGCPPLPHTHTHTSLAVCIPARYAAMTLNRLDDAPTVRPTGAKNKQLFFSFSFFFFIIRLKEIRAQLSSTKVDPLEIKVCGLPAVPCGSSGCSAMLFPVLPTVIVHGALLVSVPFLFQLRKAAGRRGLCALSHSPLLCVEGE